MCSDGLLLILTNRCPDNGAKVNINDCSITQNIGSSELKANWIDPDFDNETKSFYYARVLENPTCRWSMGCNKEAINQEKTYMILFKKELGHRRYGTFHQQVMLMSFLLGNKE